MIFSTWQASPPERAHRAPTWGHEKKDPGGAEGYEHGGWSFTFDQGDEGRKFKFDELMAADAQLLCTTA